MKNQYRKKLVVIEAFQMTKERREDNREWPNWLHSAWNKERAAEGCLQPTIDPAVDVDDTGTLSIVTLEGVHLVGWNDWIIQGVKDEIYPCKPDIFSATYEEVNPQ